MATATAVERPPATAGLIGIEAWCDALGLGRRTVWRWLSEGKIPAPDVRIGEKVVRWRAERIEEWIDANTRTD
ncbi:MAG TPA: helix-turn-helix domain-containing protein [Tepidisphaeraceae bacterium]|nr:helix-turn-helix domain-containing protein [Tepidisphaeraceae bacterium]